MKPSRIVSSSSSPKASYLSYHPRQKGNGSSWHDGAALLVVGPARNLVRYRIFPVHGGHLPTLSEGVRASTRCSAHAARRLLATSAAGTSARRFEGSWSTSSGIRRRCKSAFPMFPEPVNVMISGVMLVQWTASPGTHIAAKVPAAIDALAHGDATPIARTWAEVRLNPASIGVIGNGLFYGVSCGEWVPYESARSVIAAGRRAFPTFPLSVHRNAPNLQFIRSNCDVWNVPPVSRSIRDITHSSIPTLVISSQYDAQTAPSFGPLVARTLTNSTVVEIPSVAHVAFGSPSPDANACAWSRLASAERSSSEISV